MFSKKKRIRRDPYFSIYEAQQPIRLDEARLDAWALSIGQRRETYRPKARPHRGMLPDVDFSQGVPVERRPGPIVRLFRRLFRRNSDEPTPVGETGAGETGRTEGPHAALGEAPRKPYVWLIEADVSGPDDRQSSVPVVKYNGSRAA